MLIPCQGLSIKSFPFRIAFNEKGSGVARCIDKTPISCMSGTPEMFLLPTIKVLGSVNISGGMETEGYRMSQ